MEGCSVHFCRRNFILITSQITSFIALYWRMAPGKMPSVGVWGPLCVRSRRAGLADRRRKNGLPSAAGRRRPRPSLVSRCNRGEPPFFRPEIRPRSPNWAALCGRVLSGRGREGGGGGGRAAGDWSATESHGREGSESCCCFDPDLLLTVAASHEGHVQSTHSIAVA